jgi:mRNA interferase RelE/StbE
MKVEYSKEFEKTARKLAGKNLNSLKVAILDVKKAKNIKELTDCKKLVGYENIYPFELEIFVLFSCLE